MCNNNKCEKMVGSSSTYDPRFKVPGNMQIVGPSLSGKTTWLYKLIKNASTYFTCDDGRGGDDGACHFRKILYCYGSSWQPIFDTMREQSPPIQFNEGLPPTPLSDSFNENERPGLLILDDLMQESVKSSDISNILTRDSHHLNLFTITLSQNLYPGGKEQATQNRNYHYTVLFKNPADTRYVKALGNRWTGDSKSFYEIYKKATSKPYGYLVVDNHPRTPEAIRFRTNILIEEQDPITVLQV